MNEVQRHELIQYRLERADVTLEEANILMRENKLLGAVNRIYYAVFYATSAVLLKQGHSSGTYAGLIALFHRELVNKGVLDKEYGKILERSFANRTAGDYKDRRKFENDQVDSFFIDGKKFIEKIKEIVKVN
jgi:uncharacterized protein (UPF0332 family)